MLTRESEEIVALSKFHVQPTEVMCKEGHKFGEITCSAGHTLHFQNGTIVEIIDHGPEVSGSIRVASHGIVQRLTSNCVAACSDIYSSQHVGKLICVKPFKSQQLFLFRMDWT